MKDFKPKARLLASSASLDGIRDCIAKFYGGEQKRFNLLAKDVWTLHQSDGKQIPNVRVILKKGRYHFESFAVVK